jgi:hypothetical protein
MTVAWGMSGKQRLSAAVDAELLEAADDAAARGVVQSVSACVNDARRLKLAQERRLEALARLRWFCWPQTGLPADV